MPDKVPECLPDRTPEDLPDRMPDRMSEGMPEDMPDRVPEDMPEHMPGRMPEDMPDRMPDRMPENMSDRMPEDLPETKCINVMVGITRSKVIWFTAKESDWVSKHLQSCHSTQKGTCSLGLALLELWKPKLTVHWYLPRQGFVHYNRLYPALSFHCRS